MEFEKSLSKELLLVIEKNFYNKNYSGAILDAMYLLTETIREKTGLEGDGAVLVGQAFGRNNPKIKLNKLQTDSEKNEQKGIQEILRGLYTAVRNPRSHDKYEDSKEDAEALIFFIDYLLRLIDKSKLNFEEEDYLKRVFDNHFVVSKEYANLLIDEIPSRQKTNIAISVILRRKEGNIKILELFLNCLIDKLEESEIDRIYSVISDELKHAEDEGNILSILHCCSEKYWEKINKAIRLRIENIIKKDIKSGRYNSDEQRFYGGELGTWLEPEYILKFSNLEMWTDMFTLKLMSGDVEERDYVINYHWKNIEAINRSEMGDFFKNYLIGALKSQDEEIIERLGSILEYDEDHLWWTELKNEIEEYTEIEYDEEWAILFGNNKDQG